MWMTRGPMIEISKICFCGAAKRWAPCPRVFLRYLDSNYVNACSSQNMERSRLRRSLVGAIRYGKPLVVDVMDVDMWWGWGGAG